MTKVVDDRRRARAPDDAPSSAALVGRLRKNAADLRRTEYWPLAREAEEAADAIEKLTRTI